MGDRICTEDGLERKLQLPLQYLKDITDNFSSDRKIGEGGFGVVYKGIEVESGVVMAVKKLRPIIGEQDKQFKNEADHLARVNHNNIVKLIGYCDETKEGPVYDEYQQKYIVAEMQHKLLCYEFLSNGSLDNIIFDQSLELDWQDRYKIVVGICDGLRYLHEGLDNTPIIHMDLKPSNILLDDMMEPKIADFGLSRLFSEEQTRTCTMNLMGSIGYMAPEYLLRGEISTKSDIYSLGILILEVVTGKRNHQAMRNKSGEQFIEDIRKNWIDMSQIASKLPSLGTDCLQQVHTCIEIGLSCVEADQERRPSAGQVLLHMLSGECTYKLDQPERAQDLPMYGQRVKLAMLARPIQLADEVTMQCAAPRSFGAECSELKARAEDLAALMRLAARAPDLYYCPAARIMAEATTALSRASALAAKCARGHPRLRSLFMLRPAAEFPRAVAALDMALEDVTWLLRISSPGGAGDTDGDLPLPNIAQNDPILFLIWDNVARLLTGSPAARADSAANLTSLARDNQRFAKIIIEEDGVPPLLKLLKDGTDEGQEAAACALGLLGCDAESVDKLVQAGVCSSLAAALNDATMPVQAAVAEAIANLADRSSTCQDLFAQNNAVRYLVGHLASGSGTIQEHSRRYSVFSHSSKNSTAAPQQAMKDPEMIKAYLKAMAAKALWKLARNHLVVCKSITESQALLCFAVLLEKGDGDTGTEVQFFSAMAIMEIALVTDHTQSAFKPSSPAAKALVDQLLRVVRKGEDDDVLLLPCITALGCLARTFAESETTKVVIALLVQLLDEREPPVTKEAVVALTKFACPENHLHVNNSKAIVDNGGARHLAHLVYLAGDEIQIEALILLCSIALYVPENEELAQGGVMPVLLWASKQAHMVQDTRVKALLPDAKAMLELFHSRGSRRYWK
ncbi:unnamed protein product [Urochloa humidicola]